MKVRNDRYSSLFGAKSNYPWADWSNWWVVGSRRRIWESTQLLSPRYNRAFLHACLSQFVQHGGKRWGSVKDYFLRFFLLKNLRLHTLKYLLRGIFFDGWMDGLKRESRFGRGKHGKGFNRKWNAMNDETFSSMFLSLSVCFFIFQKGK